MRGTVLAGIVLVALTTMASSADAHRRIGDLRRPILGVGDVVLLGGAMDVYTMASAGAVTRVTLSGLGDCMITGSTPMDSLVVTHVRVPAPPSVLPHLCDCRVEFVGGASDSSVRTVRVLHQWPTRYGIVHITDTHVPSHRSGLATYWDTNSMPEFDTTLEASALIDPMFLLHTGDLIDFFVTESQYEFAQDTMQRYATYPIMLMPGNHDLYWSSGDSLVDPSGWVRWNRYFGGWWNYTFAIGGDRWLSMAAWDIGDSSFSNAQMAWADSQLGASQLAGEPFRAMAYHCDMRGQTGLGQITPTFVNSHDVSLTVYGHIHMDGVDSIGRALNVMTMNTTAGSMAYRYFEMEDHHVRRWSRGTASLLTLRIDTTHVAPGLDSLRVVITNRDTLGFDTVGTWLTYPRGGNLTIDGSRARALASYGGLDGSAMLRVGTAPLLANDSVVFTVGASWPASVRDDARPRVSPSATTLHVHPNPGAGPFQWRSDDPSVTHVRVRDLHGRAVDVRGAHADGVYLVEGLDALGHVIAATRWISLR